MLYRNKGAPFRRDDGSVWDRGQDAEPTERELRQFNYKLRPVRAAEKLGPPVVNAPPPEQQDDPLPAEDEWPLAMSPSQYIKLHPKGELVGLARKKLKSASEQPSDKEQPDGDKDDGR